MENSKPVIGADFNSNGITNIVVGQVIDGVFTVIDQRQLNCKKGDDNNKDSEFRKTISELLEKWNARFLGTTKSFRYLNRQFNSKTNEKRNNSKRRK